MSSGLVERLSRNLPTNGCILDVIHPAFRKAGSDNFRAVAKDRAARFVEHVKLHPELNIAYADDDSVDLSVTKMIDIPAQTLEILPKFESDNIFVAHGVPSWATSHDLTQAIKDAFPDVTLPAFYVHIPIVGPSTKTRTPVSVLFGSTISDDLKAAITSARIPLAPALGPRSASWPRPARQSLPSDLAITLAPHISTPIPKALLLPLAWSLAAPQMEEALTTLLMDVEADLNLPDSHKLSNCLPAAPATKVVLIDAFLRRVAFTSLASGEVFRSPVDLQDACGDVCLIRTPKEGADVSSAVRTVSNQVSDFTRAYTRSPLALLFDDEAKYFTPTPKYHGPDATPQLITCIDLAAIDALERHTGPADPLQPAGPVRCNLCTKSFQDARFTAKHLINRHPEAVQAISAEVTEPRLAVVVLDALEMDLSTIQGFGVYSTINDLSRGMVASHHNNAGRDGQQQRGYRDSGRDSRREPSTRGRRERSRSRSPQGRYNSAGPRRSGSVWMKQVGDGDSTKYHDTDALGSRRQLDVKERLGLGEKVAEVAAKGQTRAAFAGAFDDM